MDRPFLLLNHLTRAVHWGRYPAWGPLEVGWLLVGNLRGLPRGVETVDSNFSYFVVKIARVVVECLLGLVF